MTLQLGSMIVCRVKAKSAGQGLKARRATGGPPPRPGDWLMKPSNTNAELPQLR